MSNGFVNRRLWVRVPSSAFFATFFCKRWPMKRYIIFVFMLLAAITNAEHKTPADIAAQYGNAIVSVNILKKDGSAHSGTGFIAHSDGLIATAGHVIKDAVFVNLTFKNGVVSEEAAILDTTQNKEVDLALLKIQNRNLPTIEFKNADYVKPGDPITVIGNPRRLQNTVTNGLISQIRRVSKSVIWLQISAPISPSSSGSPVFDEEGKVIAIALSSLKGDDNQNINFAIPSNYLLQMIRKNGYVVPMASKYSYEDTVWGRFKQHCAKSWRILKNKLSKIF